MSAASMNSATAQIWLWPAAIALLTVFGLLSALLGQSAVWWVLSWIALAVPLAIIVWFVVKGLPGKTRAESVKTRR
jgi:hypothetical protein